MVGCDDNPASQTAGTAVKPDAEPPGTEPSDAEPSDAGPPDTEPLDAEAPDSKPPDSEPPDSEPPDAQPPDDQPPDAQPPDAQPPDAGPPPIPAQSERQGIDGFSWQLDERLGEELGYRYYSELPADRGKLLGGDAQLLHDVTIADGAARIVAHQGDQGTSFAGLWWSLAGTATEEAHLLDFERALPAPIVDTYQTRIRAIRLRLAGAGHFKLELKDAYARRVHLWEGDLDTSEDPLQAPVREERLEVPTGLPAAKLLVFLVDSPADIRLDDIAFEVESPPIPPS